MSIESDHQVALGRVMVISTLRPGNLVNIYFFMHVCWETGIHFLSLTKVYLQIMRKLFWNLAVNFMSIENIVFYLIACRSDA